MADWSITDRLRNHSNRRRNCDCVRCEAARNCDCVRCEAAYEIERLAFERDQHRDAANAFKAEAERLRSDLNYAVSELRRLEANNE